MGKRAGQQQNEEAFIRRSASAERNARAGFSSSQAGNLWICFRSCQNVLAGLLQFPAVLDTAPSVRQQALQAIACNCYRLSRCADLAISSGYARESILMVRAIYEKVAMALRVHTDEKLASKLLTHQLGMSDVDNYVAGWRENIRELFEEYKRIRGFAGITLPDIGDFINSLGPLYGQLSRFAHPIEEASQPYYELDPESDAKIFDLLPDTSSRTLPVVMLQYLIMMQFTIMLLLLVVFDCPNDPNWSLLQQLADRWMARFPDVSNSQAEHFEQHLQTQSSDVFDRLSSSRGHDVHFPSNHIRLCA